MPRQNPAPGAVLAGVLALTLSCAANDKLTPKDELKQWLDRGQNAYDKLKDYTCIFVQREQVNDELLPEEHVQMKFKKPFMVYMKWVGKVREGQECLYGKDLYDNKLIAHGTGVLGLVTVKLDPAGKVAMDKRRHPITEAGIGHLLELLRKDQKLAAEHNEGLVIDKGTATDANEVKDKLQARELRLFECILPRDKRPEYYCHRAVVGFDTKLMLPVSISIYDAKDRLLEQYRYQELKLDVGLTARDFDKDNPKYGF